MKYRHKVTGAVIDVNSTMGGSWQAVEESAPATPPAADKTAAEKPKTTRKTGGKAKGDQ